MTAERSYQQNFSDLHAGAMYDDEGRSRKARTIVAVLNDFFATGLRSLSLLDIGASTGIVDNHLADHFAAVVGIDIDQPAISFANRHHNKANLNFMLGDAMNLAFRDSSFDVIVCAQIYEHMPDSKRLMSEVHRVLKPGGICYFSAGNRLNIIEPHYRLPFLSVIPRPLAHAYLRLSGRGRFYYEKHLSYWGLRKLVRRFEMHDYTAKIVSNPRLFHAEYMIRPDSIKGKIGRFVVHFAYSLCPGYIWLLRKPG